MSIAPEEPDNNPLPPPSEPPSPSLPDAGAAGPPKRRGRVGFVRKPGRFEAAEFVEGGPAVPTSADPAAPETPAAEAEPPAQPSPPDEGQKILDMLEAAKAREIEQARQRLEAGMPLRPAERKLLERHFAKSDDDAPPADADAEMVPKTCEAMDIYWVNGARGVFQVRDGAPQWLEVQREDLHAMLLARGVSDERVGKARVKQYQECVTHTIKYRTLDRAFEGLAGFLPGVHVFKSVRVLVRKGPVMIQPAAGDWPVLHDLIAGALMLDDFEPGDRRGQVQFWRFLYWLKRAALNVQQPGPDHMNSQVMILAGPAGSGKSRLQHLVITPLLGDRSADPQLYMFGESPFNEGWMGCEHLLIEDPKPQGKTYDKLAFAQKLKALTVNQQHNFHAKHQGEFTVPTRFVISMSINDDPDALRMLPKLTPDFAEKVMLLKVRAYPPPMPTETPEQKRALQTVVQAEMPAFLDFLVNLQVPGELKDPRQRFGVLRYHNPELAQNLSDDSAEADLLGLLDHAVIKSDGGYGLDKSLWELDNAIDAAEFMAVHPKAFPENRVLSDPHQFLKRCAAASRRVWIGTALELQDVMERCAHQRAWRKIVDHNKIDRLLQRLAEDQPERACYYRTNTARRWMIAASGPTAQSDADAF